MSLKTWAGFQEYRRITPMALFALQAAADGEPRVRLNPWRDWPPRRGSARRLRPARRRTSPAGGAGRHRTGCAVRRGGCRRGFPCRAADRAAQGLLQLAGTAGEGAGANGGSAALDGMQGRGAALDIALAELAFELGEEVLHVRNEAPQHLDDQLQAAAKRPTISPRASASSPASAAVAGAPPLLPR